MFPFPGYRIEGTLWALQKGSNWYDVMLSKVTGWTFQIAHDRAIYHSLIGHPLSHTYAPQHTVGSFGAVLVLVYSLSCEWVTLYFLTNNIHPSMSTQLYTFMEPWTRPSVQATNTHLSIYSYDDVTSCPWHSSLVQISALYQWCSLVLADFKAVAWLCTARRSVIVLAFMLTLSLNWPEASAHIDVLWCTILWHHKAVMFRSLQGVCNVVLAISAINGLELVSRAWMVQSIGVHLQ